MARRKGKKRGGKKRGGKTEKKIEMVKEVLIPAVTVTNGEEAQSQHEICYICGDKGFTTILINCSECIETHAHQYCLGIIPGSIDDSYNWLCEYCCPPMESEPCSSTKSGGASIKQTKKSKKRKRESEVPFTLGSKCKRIRKERTEDQSLSIGKGSSSENDWKIDSLPDHKTESSSTSMPYSDGNVRETLNDIGAIILVEDEPKPLMTLQPSGFSESSDDEEENTEYGSSRMENPEELMRGIVLLVSPSGETFIAVTDEDFEAFCYGAIDFYERESNLEDTTMNFVNETVFEEGEECC